MLNSSATPRLLPQTLVTVTTAFTHFDSIVIYYFPERLKYLVKFLII
jgi:hypothetical protein